MCYSSSKRFIIWLLAVIQISSLGRALAAAQRPSTQNAILQKAAQNAIHRVSDEGRVGCVVVLDMQGRVLAMADTGSSGDTPLALSLRGTPGRLFTPFTALAALAGGYLTLDETISELGAFSEVNPRHPSYCWISAEQRYKHQNQTVGLALANTCDYFFYTLGHRMGLANWQAMGEKLGLSRPSGLNAPGESANVLAREDILEAVMGRSTSQITPMAMARYWVALGNGGYVYDPVVFQDEAPKLAGDLSAELGPYLPTILSAMEGVIDVTGVSPKHFRKCEYRDQIYSIIATEALAGQGSVSWIAGLAPVGKPEICVVAFWKGGDRIPRVVSVFQGVMDAYFDQP